MKKPKQDQFSKTCRVKICDGDILARGLCAAHLRRLYKKGNTQANIPIKRRVWGSSLARTAEHKIWRNLRYRCNNPNSKSYRDYGKRGIKVCKRWDSFENFFKDMGKRPAGKLSIERKNNNKGYSPDNCKWGTHSEQMRNRRPRSEWRFK